MADNREKKPSKIPRPVSAQPTRADQDQAFRKVHQDKNPTSSSRAPPALQTNSLEVQEKAEEVISPETLVEFSRLRLTSTTQRSEQAVAWENKLKELTFNPLPRLLSNPTSSREKSRLIDAVASRVLAGFNTRPNHLPDEVNDFVADLTEGESHGLLAIEIARHKIFGADLTKAVTCFRAGRWIEAFSLIKYPALPRAITPPTEIIVSHWESEYIGDSAQTLRGMLEQYEQQWIGEEHERTYGKILAIFQSSGMGKSRTVSELGKKMFELVFVIRRPGETGFPPEDPEVGRYLGEDCRGNLDILRVASLYAACATVAKVWIKEQKAQGPITTEQVILLWHKNLAPDHAHGGDDDDGEEPEDDLCGGHFAYVRSSFKRKIFAEIVNQAEALFQSHRRTWPSMQPLELLDSFRRGKKFHHTFVKPLEALCTILRPPSTASTTKMRPPEPIVVITFDEASNISPKFLKAMRRFVNMFSHEQVSWWTMVLSTNNAIDTLLPKKTEDSSGRVADGTFERLPPLLSLSTDVEVHKRLAAEETYMLEVRKSLELISKIDHLAMFGRPLWTAYSTSSYASLIQIVCEKAMGGPVQFDPRNKLHVFTACAARLDLDTCTNSEAGLSLAKRSVNSHLRLVQKYDQETGYISTMTLSEPILAEAMTALLMTKEIYVTASTTVGNVYAVKWVPVIEEFGKGLLKGGVVDRGTKGEIFARLLLILARDFCISDENFMTPDERTCRWSQPFRLTALLGALLPPPLMNSLIGYHKLNKTTKGNQGERQFHTAFENAWCNFNHWTSTPKCLSGKSLRELLHELLRQSAALQLAPNQENWDGMIPIYFGNPTEDFQEEKVSAIFIQVKNRKNPTQICLLPKSKLFKNIVQPVLALHLNIGALPAQCGPPKIVSRRTEQQEHFGVRLDGINASVYRFLQDEHLFHACRHVMNHINLSESINDRISQMNQRFGTHTRAARFPNSAAVASKLEKPTTGGFSEDEDMVDQSEDSDDVDMEDDDPESDAVSS